MGGSEQKGPQGAGAQKLACGEVLVGFCVYPEGGPRELCPRSSAALLLAAHRC